MIIDIEHIDNNNDTSTLTPMTDLVFRLKLKHGHSRHHSKKHKSSDNRIKPSAMKNPSHHKKMTSKPSSQWINNDKKKDCHTFSSLAKLSSSPPCNSLQKKSHDEKPEHIFTISSSLHIHQSIQNATSPTKPPTTTSSASFSNPTENSSPK